MFFEIVSANILPKEGDNNAGAPRQRKDMAATDNAAEQAAHIAEKIRAGKTTLGIEFGSTRIKAVLIDDNFQTIASGDYSWASHLEDGLWLVARWLPLSLLIINTMVSWRSI